VMQSKKSAVVLCQINLLVLLFMRIIEKASVSYLYNELVVSW